MTDNGHEYSKKIFFNINVNKFSSVVVLENAYGTGGDLQHKSVTRFQKRPSHTSPSF